MIRGESRTDRDEATSPEVATQVEALRADLRALGRSLARALKLEWLNFKTEAFDTSVKVAVWCGVLAFFLVLFISAASFVAAGVRDMLGDLPGGLVLVGLILAFGIGLRFRWRSQALRTAKQVLAKKEPEK